MIELDIDIAVSRRLSSQDYVMVEAAKILSRIWSTAKVSLTTLIWPPGLEGATRFVLAADFTRPGEPSVGLCKLSAEGGRSRLRSGHHQAISVSLDWGH